MPKWIQERRLRRKASKDKVVKEKSLASKISDLEIGAARLSKEIIKINPEEGEEKAKLEDLNKQLKSVETRLAGLRELAYKEGEDYFATDASRQRKDAFSGYLKMIHATDGLNNIVKKLFGLMIDELRGTLGARLMASIDTPKGTLQEKKIINAIFSSLFGLQEYSSETLMRLTEESDSINRLTYDDIKQLIGKILKLLQDEDLLRNAFDSLELGDSELSSIITAYFKDHLGRDIPLESKDKIAGLSAVFASSIKDYIISNTISGKVIYLKKRDSKSFITALKAASMRIKLLLKSKR